MKDEDKNDNDCNFDFKKEEFFITNHITMYITRKIEQNKESRKFTIKKLQLANLIQGFIIMSCAFHAT